MLGIMRHVARHAEANGGKGTVPGALATLARRMFGFELQFGPFAVAELRLLAEMQSLVADAGGGALATTEGPPVYLTDTLDDPYAKRTTFSPMVRAIGESREKADRIKREEPITVVIGNPPYKEKAKGRGGWIETGLPGRGTPLSWWMPPPDWKVGAHSKHLRNLYVFFWRWAAMKVFGSGWKTATGDDHERSHGIVCFITVAGFLNGPGFQRMRADLRETCSAVWVIDCSPEGHQPDVPTRVFGGVQQPVCIVLAARRPEADATPATVRFLALPEGRREGKFEALNGLSLSGSPWRDCPHEPRAPFLPEDEGVWATLPPLEDLFVYDGSGVMPGRTWVIAPDRWSLEKRWKRLVGEADAEWKELLFHPHGGGDKTSTKSTKVGLAGHELRTGPVATDLPKPIAPARFAFRSFDRQWIIPDNRIINRPNPTLWNTHSGKQVFLTAPQDRTPENGPALSIAGDIPDLHHYHGRGGRVYPLYRDAAATVPNIRPALLAHLSTRYGRKVEPDEVMAYVAALLAHSAFTARFADDLRRPGLHVPLTGDVALFDRGVELGREVVWLHTYGERFADPAGGRPAAPPRVAKDGPTIPAGGAIPGHELPETMRYDPAARRLHIGAGHVDNVTQAMVDYEVSGMNVLGQWFSYRRRDRSRPVIGDRRPPSPLSAIQPDGWLPEYTDDLLDLLHVLGRLVALEPEQAALLDDVLAGDLFDHAALLAAGALDRPS